jgi:hypothetical protein
MHACLCSIGNAMISLGLDYFVVYDAYFEVANSVVKYEGPLSKLLN